MSSAPRTVVLSDLHLVRETPPALAADLASLTAAHAGARLLFLGDLFDLPASTPRGPHRQTVTAALGAHPSARAALGRHLDGGGELWLLGGNHDAEVGTEGFGAHLVAALGASRVPRRGCAPRPGSSARARSTWSTVTSTIPTTRPPTRSSTARRAWASTSSRSSSRRRRPSLPADQRRHPAEALPLLVHHLRPARPPRSSPVTSTPRSPPCSRAAPSTAPRPRSPPAAPSKEAFAVELGVGRDLVEAVLAQGATPTLESLSRTFSRLYFDRVIATLAITGGLGTAAAGHRLAGSAVAALGALLMITSWAQGHNRYGGAVPELLSASAERIAAATGARLVVFGHTHREADGDRYANTGSFAFPRGAPGRPFLEIEGTAEAPRATRRYWPAVG